MKDSKLCLVLGCGDVGFAVVSRLRCRFAEVAVIERAPLAWGLAMGRNTIKFITGSRSSLSIAKDFHPNAIALLLALDVIQLLKTWGKYR